MHCKYCEAEHIRCYAFHQLEQAKEVNQMFDILYPILCDIYNFGECDMDIIHILAEYSLGIAVDCSNTTQCQNEIIYDFQYQAELDLDRCTKNAYSVDVAMYQYAPKYVLDE